MKYVSPSSCSYLLSLPCPMSSAALFVAAWAMVLQIGMEEATVPLVLGRLFYQILPTLGPVLEQQGGPSSSATGFR